jgi:hypothetical protein
MRLESFFAAALFAATGGAALAHHSFAMFNSESPIEIAGTVVEFKYTSPHSFILVDVKGKDGAAGAVWNLEGPSPSILARDGMSAKTLKPGDELVMTIDPLRSGAPGGAWSLAKIKFKDGKPIAGQ